MATADPSWPGTLVDANVLLDVFTEDPVWGEWSRNRLAEAFAAAPVVINPIVYAEVSVRFSRIEDLDAALPVEIRREAVPWPAAFLAGKAFVSYRRAGGARRSPLPDFFIGAHAAVTRRTVLTRDAGRYREYFPSLRVIAP